ncbi:acyl-CoA dehydrogenase/oxidase [Pyronema domesticum]|uniref:Similar to Probable acyl-CoA dehydrogenase acc. no. O32176 n=1 Tax=Pyronema omphalodes (strain CBS 100304) TaxID=1076935 RepID=U4L1L5_PYROM|nr:acyl-CoA dehydrogenase/oxidase [Pyronema domesticum]CCX06108.1 Similar to Probable acyl-CoA dehydrogenase; acc. no. O32176 [Pyronema omphalodes CBS 100304]
MDPLPIPSKTYTLEEVAKNNTEDSLWVIIDSLVYDVTDFALGHPGGLHVLLQVAGQDATRDFYSMHRHEVLVKYKDLIIGRIHNQTPQIISRGVGQLSTVPYAEPSWLVPLFKSPYYNDSHRRFQKACRIFMDTTVRPEALRVEEAGEHPSKEFFLKCSEVGLTPMRMGPGPHLKGRKLFADIKPEEFDYFHELIMNQEFGMTHARAFNDGFGGGMVIGLPPVLNFCKNKELKERVVEEVLGSKKFIALAITEAFGGSDVVNGLRTTAVKSADGTHYVVNGTKKWITNGTFADYFTTAVKTDMGLSVLLIPRGEGVETKQIKTSYTSTAGTAFVTFDNVKVPVENLLGKENEGIKVILSNFNHERWVMTCAIIRVTRLIIEECIKWSSQRYVFGKPLISQPVIRAKIAKLISLNESSQAWLENITHQMCHMSYAQQSQALAGPIALLKTFATRAAHEAADEAVQIWGGRGITKGGMGRVIENFNRTYKFDAILGGSEEILADLAVRQAIKGGIKAVL